MRKQRLWRASVVAGVVAVLIVGSSTGNVFAETLKSSNYQATETQFGNSSTQESCSTSYCAQASIGDITTGGKSSGSNTTATFGSLQSGDPRLEVIVTPGDSDLGTLTTERTATKTTSIQVLSYLSQGYMLQVTGSPPKYSNHILNTPSTPTVSQAGTEQFGINVVENTSPSVGSDPLQVPSGDTSFGVVNDDYKTANKFKYFSGDVVAHSDKASGRTDYTISMIVNISNKTPAGHYTGDFSAVVIPVY